MVPCLHCAYVGRSQTRLSILMIPYLLIVFLMSDLLVRGRMNPVQVETTAHHILRELTELVALP